MWSESVPEWMISPEAHKPMDWMTNSGCGGVGCEDTPVITDEGDYQAEYIAMIERTDAEAREKLKPILEAERKRSEERTKLFLDTQRAVALGVSSGTRELERDLQGMTGALGGVQGSLSSLDNVVGNIGAHISAADLDSSMSSLGGAFNGLLDSIGF